tara:strand:+ start:4128 stop:4568 length:441 start_codon:yes stop_codon:yes gene_type:complete
MNFQEFQNKFLEWTENEIEAKKLDGFPICPFARKARLQNKIQFIDARDNQSDTYETFDKDQYEIGIAWVDGCDMDQVESVIEQQMQKHNDLLYFTSTTTSGHFAKNFTNCVFIQLRDDLTEKRKYLHTTKYYDSWPLDYYKLITSV